MTVVQSNFDKFKTDFAEWLTPDTDFLMGYLICDRVAIWDPVWINPNEEILPPVRFDQDAIARLGIEVFEMPLAGGTIVNNVGDIGLFVASKDRHSKWEIAAMEDMVQYLKLRYNLDATISGNDVLLDDKKFIGTSMGFSTFHRYAAMFISMNDDTDKLIQQICTKPSKHSGFVGLSKYDVCPRKLITRMLRFTRKWEKRCL